MKKIIKAIVIVLFCLIYGVGCDILPSISFIGSTSSSSNTAVGDATEGCQVSSESNYAELGSKSLGIKLAKKVSDIFGIARKSTAKITACYLVDGKEYETQASGFIIDKSEEANSDGKYTYYTTWPEIPIGLQERAEAGHEEGGRKLSRRPRVEKREQLGIPGGLCLDLG